MKTATNILAPFMELPIPGGIHHSIRSWKSESSETSTGLISGNFLNHHQYKISHVTPSIIVANGVANSVSFTKSFANNNPEIECRLTHSFQRLKIGQADFEKLRLWMHCNHAIESYGRKARKEEDNIINKMKNHESVTPIENSGIAVYSSDHLDIM